MKTAHGLVLGLLCALASTSPAQACSAFAVFRNGLALAGNNEDFWLTNTKVWYVPKAGSTRGLPGHFGRVYFGFANFYPQGGMNEAGLFFDGFATEFLEPQSAVGKERFSGNLSDHALATCATVQEVADLFARYDLSWLSSAQLFFADASGDAVIIEGDQQIRIDGDHQIVTNFRQSRTAPGQYSCPRYLKATQMLESKVPISVERSRDILNAMHQEGEAQTVYSNVYDLKKRIVYLYHFHDYEHVVHLDLHSELELGPHELDLPSLFPQSASRLAFDTRRAEEIRRQTEARRARVVDAASLKEACGSFVLHTHEQNEPLIEVQFENGKLYAARATERIELIPEAKDRYFHIGDFGLETWAFERNRNRDVIGLQLQVWGRTLRGERID